MEFKFDVNEVFKSPIVEINQSLVPPGFKGERRQLWDCVNKVSEVINAMGEASAAAQGLSKPITTAERLRNSEQTVYLLIDEKAQNGKGAVMGMLKTGKKGLYVFDRHGQHYQVSPPCVLDFYVHESKQRQGLGKRLFEHMLEKEKVEPVKMAIDRPSDKLLGFLRKHYGLQSPVKQMNNFVVFDDFFPKGDQPDGESNREVPSRTRGANGLQSTVTSPYGRYGAPRPPCSMGQIIHNQTSVLTTASEPSGMGIAFRDNTKNKQNRMNQQSHMPPAVSNSVPNMGWQQYYQMVNPNMINPNMVNPNMVNPNVVNPNIVNPNMVNPNMVNPNMVNSNIVNPNMVNPNFVNPQYAQAQWQAYMMQNPQYSGQFVQPVGNVQNQMWNQIPQADVRGQGEQLPNAQMMNTTENKKQMQQELAWSQKDNPNPQMTGNYGGTGDFIQQPNVPVQMPNQNQNYQQVAYQQNASPVILQQANNAELQANANIAQQSFNQTGSVFLQQPPVQTTAAEIQQSNIQNAIPELQQSNIQNASLQPPTALGHSQPAVNVTSEQQNIPVQQAYSNQSQNQMQYQQVGDSLNQQTVNVHQNIEKPSQPASQLTPNNTQIQQNQFSANEQAQTNPKSANPPVQDANRIPYQRTSGLQDEDQTTTSDQQKIPENNQTPPATQGEEVTNNSPANNQAQSTKSDHQPTGAGDIQNEPNTAVQQNIQQISPQGYTERASGLQETRQFQEVDQSKLNAEPYNRMDGLQQNTNLAVQPNTDTSQSKIVSPAFGLQETQMKQNYVNNQEQNININNNSSWSGLQNVQSMEELQQQQQQKVLQQRKAFTVHHAKQPENVVQEGQSERLRGGGEGISEQNEQTQQQGIIPQYNQQSSQYQQNIPTGSVQKQNSPLTQNNPPQQLNQNQNQSGNIYSQQNQNPYSTYAVYNQQQPNVQAGQNMPITHYAMPTQNVQGYQQGTSNQYQTSQQINPNINKQMAIPAQNQQNEQQYQLYAQQPTLSNQQMINQSVPMNAYQMPMPGTQPIMYQNQSDKVQYIAPPNQQPYLNQTASNYQKDQQLRQTKSAVTTSRLNKKNPRNGLDEDVNVRKSFARVKDAKSTPAAPQLQETIFYGYSQYRPNVPPKVQQTPGQATQNQQSNKSPASTMNQQSKPSTPSHQPHTHSGHYQQPTVGIPPQTYPQQQLQQANPTTAHAAYTHLQSNPASFQNQQQTVSNQNQGGGMSMQQQIPPSSQTMQISQTNQNQRQQINVNPQQGYIAPPSVPVMQTPHSLMYQQPQQGNVAQPLVTYAQMHQHNVPVQNQQSFSPQNQATQQQQYLAAPQISGASNAVLQNQQFATNQQQANANPPIINQSQSQVSMTNVHQQPNIIQQTQVTPSQQYQGQPQFSTNVEPQTQTTQPQQYQGQQQVNSNMQAQQTNLTPQQYQSQQQANTNTQQATAATPPQQHQSQSQANAGVQPQQPRAVEPPQQYQGQQQVNTNLQPQQTRAVTPTQQYQGQPQLNTNVQPQQTNATSSQQYQAQPQVNTNIQPQQTRTVAPPQQYQGQPQLNRNVQPQQTRTAVPSQQYQGQPQQTWITPPQQHQGQSQVNIQPQQHQGQSQVIATNAQQAQISPYQQHQGQIHANTNAQPQQSQSQHQRIQQSQPSSAVPQQTKLAPVNQEAKTQRRDLSPISMEKPSKLEYMTVPETNIFRNSTQQKAPPPPPPQAVTEVKRRSIPKQVKSTLADVILQKPKMMSVLRRADAGDMPALTKESFTTLRRMSPKSPPNKV